MPGPRDRDGLPESLRFWKTPDRIGRSRPHVQAWASSTAPRAAASRRWSRRGSCPGWQKAFCRSTSRPARTKPKPGCCGAQGLPKVSPDLAGPWIVGLGQIKLVPWPRCGGGRVLGSGQKVLLVLDQFEQWLFAKRGEHDPELLAALRQCDGAHLQAIVTVRDDFWMAATRFMRDLEIRLVEGENSAAVDLFDLRHARRVLAAFGRAYGILPEQPSEPTSEQQAFLDQSVAGLAQDGKVISVRLALFAEMVKGKPWVPATLREVGGTEGVGVTFLEETFSAARRLPSTACTRKPRRPS